MPKDVMPNDDTHKSGSSDEDRKEAAKRRKADLLAKMLADIHRAIDRLECHNKDRHAELMYAIQEHAQSQFLGKLKALDARLKHLAKIMAKLDKETPL
jgi:hypothetical protein